MKHKFTKIWQWIKQFIHSIESKYSKPLSITKKVWRKSREVVALIAFFDWTIKIMKWLFWALIVLLGCS